MADAYFHHGRDQNQIKMRAKRASSHNFRGPTHGGNERRRSTTPSGESSEKKILNSDWKGDEFDKFFAVCDTFKESLKELDFSENTHQIYKKLNEIKSLIDKKILMIQKSGTGEKLSYSASSSISDLSVSMQSLCLKKSCDPDPDMDLDTDAFFEKFMTAVNCPFCLEIQSDKNSFVKHLEKSCSPHLKKELKKEIHFPFATFQILPNNTFKCNICINAVQQNLRNFYVHIKNESHVKNYIKAARLRNYENCLFCSCCKTLVHNNYTQISSHINHEAHKKKCSDKKTSDYFKLKGICCVFTESKKFKCLDCPLPFAISTTPRGVLDHFEGVGHKKYKKKNVHSLPLLYCEVCSEEVHMFKVINHFISSQHCDNEKKLKERGFQLCFCCNFFCESLMELSFHMESDCVGINKIRQQISNESGPKKQTRVEVNVTKGPCITVKNFTEIPALFKYFRKFGEIVKIESDNEEDVVIEFRDKSTVDAILLLQDVITVGGIKLHITTDSERGESVRKVHETESKIGISEDEVSDRSSNSEDDPDADDAVNMIQDDQLDELFGRVSDHLIKTAEKLNSTEEENIRRACIQTLKTEKCHFVGFSGSGLSFPSERVNIFCGVGGCTFEDTVNDSFPSLNGSDIFTKNLLKASYIKLCDSELWEEVNYGMTEGPYSYIKCVHKETERTCAITFAKSTLVLTDMLRECIEKSELVQPFCLIIRFWLSVHELKIQNSEFALISLLVFFLINVNVVTLSAEKYKGHGFQSLFTKEVIEAIQPSPKKIKPVVNVKELFQKFLHFADTFDFDRDTIYLPLQCSIPKSVFSQSKLKLLPGMKDLEALKNSSMCILDPILCENLAADIENKDKKAFLKIVGETVKHYKIK